MAIQCPKCRRQYDVTLFQFGRTVRCECGERLDLRQGHLSPAEPPEAETEPAEPDEPSVEEGSG